MLCPFQCIVSEDSLSTCPINGDAAFDHLIEVVSTSLLHDKVTVIGKHLDPTIFTFTDDSHLKHLLWLGSPNGDLQKPSFF
jgi:hypothetical protein